MQMKKEMSSSDLQNENENLDELGQYQGYEILDDIGPDIDWEISSVLSSEISRLQKDGSLKIIDVTRELFNVDFSVSNFDLVRCSGRLAYKLVATDKSPDKKYNGYYVLKVHDNGIKFVLVPGENVVFNK